MSAVQTRQQIKNHFAGAEVQVACGLVGEQYRRAAYQRARQDHALLLSSGQFPRTMRGSAAFECVQPRISNGIITFSNAVNSGKR